MLEYSLIKQHRPRFNVRLVDDKSYPFLAVTVGDEWPRPMVDAGGASARACATSGPTPTPTPSARRSTCCCARSRSAPAATPSSSRHERLGRPCLLFHIEKCSGPCVGDDRQARPTTSWSPSCSHFLDGDTDAVVQRLETEMQAAADELEFERAARLRDRLAAGPQGHREAADGRATATRTSTSIGIADDDLEAAVQVFFVRRGRVVGRKGFIVDKVEDLDRRRARRRRPRGPLRRRARPRACPKTVLVPDLPDDLELYEEWLAALRGSRVDDPGAPAGRQARPCRRRWRATPRRSSPATACAGPPTTTAAPGPSTSCRSALGLPEAPLRIECYDMSHIQGTDYVGSMVVIEDGLPPRSPSTAASRCRRCAGNDDFAAMEEVLTRRLTHYLDEREQPVAERGRFQYPPQLLMVDGGKGQLERGRAGARRAGPDRRDPGVRPGQAVRGGLPARAVRADPHPPAVRGAVPAAADPRRVPPLRHHATTASCATSA